MIRSSALLALVASIFLVSCSSGTDTDNECASCRIVVEELATLGASNGPLTITNLETRASGNSRGELVLMSIYTSSLPVLDSTGTFRRTIGGLGSGPGDLRDVGSIAFGLHDSLFVFEWGNSRVSVFSPEYEFVSSVSLPFQPQIGSLVLPNGSFVFNTTVADSSAFGQPLQLVGRDGRLRRSFGSENPELLQGVPQGTSRALAYAAGGLVWSGYKTQYVIELWNPEDGALVRRLERQTVWFPPRMAVVPRDAVPPAEPASSIIDLRHDQANRALWVLLRVADPLWPQVIGPREGHGYVSVTDEQGYYDSLIEVLDDSTGTLLASIRLPQMLRQFLGTDLVGGVIEDEDAIPYFHRYRLSFSRGESTSTR